LLGFLRFEFNSLALHLNFQKLVVRVELAKEPAGVLKVLVKSVHYLRAVALWTWLAFLFARFAYCLLSQCCSLGYIADLRPGLAELFGCLLLGLKRS
jgi:hypothetical protein